MTGRLVEESLQRRIEAALHDYPYPHSENEEGPLAAEIEQRLNQDEALSVGASTAFLQCVEAFISRSLARICSRDDDWEKVPRRNQPADHKIWVVAHVEPLMQIASYAELARRLRDRRRQAVAANLKELEENDLSLPDFADRAIRPLLARPWLPRIAYEPQRNADDTRLHSERRGHGLWQSEDDEQLQTLARQADGLLSLLDLIDQELPSAHFPVKQHTLAYVRAALTVKKTRPAGLPLQAPILFVPHEPRWPLAHLLDVLLLPDEGAIKEDLATGDLRAKSLDRAKGAVRAFWDKEPVNLSAYTRLAIGDYPGGGRLGTSTSFGGPSAGLAFATAMLADQLGLMPVPRALATAGIDERNSKKTRALNDRFGLAAKGRTATLVGVTSVCVATEGDKAAIEAGMASVRDQVAELPQVHIIKEIGQAIGPPLTKDIYEGLLQHYIALGKQAME